ncbi:MAG TPA: PH domain-containing protein [Salinivirgaceae bacterium]|nr:PH domain-containing protein [Salinivirgaceae bacterium]
MKKNFGQKTVNLNEITSVESVPNSSLTMTYGTMGVFGFIGSTMDNSYSYVKDRSEMVRITRKTNYIISCEKPDGLVESIKNVK